MPTAGYQQQFQTSEWEYLLAPGAGGGSFRLPDGILPSPQIAREGMVRSGYISTSPLEVNQKRATPTEKPQGEEISVDPLIRLPGHSPLRRFRVLQQWEGVINEVRTHSFSADLIDLTDHSKPREIVEIPIEEISAEDQQLLKPGGVFYWILGYELRPGGQKCRVSEIRVRRNPIWTQRRLDLAKARGEALHKRTKKNAEDKPTQIR
jgi:hypothetical protein